MSFPSRMGNALHRIIETVERNGALKTAAARAGAKVEKALDGRRRRELLHGTWLGHSAHPFLTDFPEGAWMAASFLDLFGPEGSESSSQRLLAFGLLAAVPTGVTGWAEWSNTRGPERQSGMLHGVTSSVATLLYAASYVARRRNRHSAGVVIGVAGGVMATLDGWVGGHLSLARGAGVAKNVFDRPPAEWIETGLEAERLVEERLLQGSAGSLEIVVILGGETLSALSGRCSFDGAPLCEGTLNDDVIACAACSSAFRAEDGRVVRGPAGVPQTPIEVRVKEGLVQVRTAQQVNDLTA